MNSFCMKHTLSAFSPKQQSLKLRVPFLQFLIPFLLNLFHKCNIKFIKLFDIFLVIIFLIDFGLYLFKGPTKGQDITNEVLTFINHECKILYYF